MALIALNFLSARVAKLTVELQTAATNTEVLLRTAFATREEASRDKWSGTPIPSAT